jgi:SAM-dependent methyltransferase
MAERQIIQADIDSIEYPPSHRYILDPLEPIGILKERLELMPKEFFVGDSFLDIGCNKGFFTMYADCKYVESIDNDRRFTDIVSKISRGKVINTSFKDYKPVMEFDRIFIGNVHHYIFQECDGWEWIDKLASISSGLVLIEGPTSTKNTLVNDMLNDELKQKFTYDEFMNSMNRYFTLISITKSPYSTRHRDIMLFSRKKVDKIQLSDIGKGLTKRDNEWTKVTILKDKTVKISKQPTDDEMIRIRIASKSPISNGLMEEIYDGNRFVGWTEKFNNTYHTENNDSLDKLVQKHLIYLYKLGYTDIDPYHTNFNLNNELFDKNQVFHMSDFT